MNRIFLDLFTEKYGEEIPRSLATDIVKSFAVTDGSERKNGEKWTYEETTDAGTKLGIDWQKVSKVDFYMVANAMYSDHAKTIKKRAYSDELLLEFAKDWVCDVDAPKNKTFNYFFYNFVANM